MKQKLVMSVLDLHPLTKILKENCNINPQDFQLQSSCHKIGNTDRFYLSDEFEEIYFKLVEDFITIRMVNDNKINFIVKFVNFAKIGPDNKLIDYFSNEPITVEYCGNIIYESPYIFKYSNTQTMYLGNKTSINCQKCRIPGFIYLYHKDNDRIQIITE